MNYLNFRDKFIELGCFSVHQVYATFPDFDRNNLTRWQNKRLIVKLRQGYYSFTEYDMVPNFEFFVSNYIYRPSYISLYSALAFYDIIPEGVVQITAVSALKTADFENNFGTFSYMKMKQDLIFGYKSLPFGNHTINIAEPEKAILDLLYLYPFYNTENEIENLRFDEDFMQNELKIGKLSLYLDRFENKKLTKRVEILKNIYDI